MKNLNSKQISRFAEFLSNMAVAWFVAGLITKKSMIELLQFSILGALSIIFSLRLERGEKNGI